jgi:hypothetical protein
MPKIARWAIGALVRRGAVSEIQHIAELERFRREQNFHESPRASDRGMSPILIDENDCPRLLVPCLQQEAPGDFLELPNHGRPRGLLHQGHKYTRMHSAVHLPILLIDCKKASHIDDRQSIGGNHIALADSLLNDFRGELNPSLLFASVPTENQKKGEATRRLKVIYA